MQTCKYQKKFKTHYISLFIMLFLVMLSFVGFVPCFKVHASQETSIQSVQRNVSVKVFFEELNGNKGEVYTLALDGGYAFVDNENVQKTQKEFAFNTSQGEQIFLKAKTGFTPSVYTSYNQETGEFTGVLNSVTSEGELTTVDITNDASSTYYVVFNRKRFTLTLESEAPFKLTGQGTYLYGAKADINCEESNKNYKFLKWVKIVGDSEEDLTSSPSASYSFIVTQSIVLKAKNTLLLDIKESNNGTITVKQEGVVTSQRYFESGTTLEISATANLGYTFVAYLGNYALESQTFALTLTAPTEIDAVFESKKVTVSISASDEANCSTSHSSNVDGIKFIVGDKIHIEYTINELYSLNYILTNASGEFNRNLASQDYIITPLDAEEGEIHFIANTFKTLSEIKVEISGYGIVQIGTEVFTSYKVLNLKSNQSYLITLTPYRLFDFNEMVFSNKQTGKEEKLDAENYRLNKIFTSDGTLRIKFTAKLWYDVRTELSGTGTKQDPYLIYTPNDLAFMAYAINYNLSTKSEECVNYREARYKVMQNLDMDDRFWIQIGSNSDAEFTGALDMNYKTIKNIVQASDFKTYRSFASLFTSKTRETCHLSHDLGQLWVIIGILSTAFFATALALVLIVALTKEKDIKKVVVLNPEVIDKKS